jgi:hypothetical protein
LIAEEEDVMVMMMMMPFAVIDVNDDHFSQYTVLELTGVQ